MRRVASKVQGGTPNIAGIIGLGAAIAALHDIGLDAVAAREQALGSYALERLQAVPGLRVLGSAAVRAPVFSFTLDGAHASDVAMLLDQYGVAIRSGQHCAHPLMHRMRAPASARISLAFYNTFEEIDQFFLHLEKVRAMLG